jgi:hypothetical protein
LYSANGTIPTAEQAEGHEELLKDAKAVQAMARAAEEGRVKSTEEEEREETEQYLEALEEEEERFWDGEADVVDDGEDDDDDDDEEEMLGVAEEEEEEEVEAVTAEDKEAKAVVAEDEEEWVYGPAWDPVEKNMMRPTREESPVVPEVRP